MKRLPIGIAVLVGLLILGFWTSHRAETVHGAIVEALQEAARAENWAQTGAAETARRGWEEHRTLTTAIADHTVLDEIEAGFSQLEAFRRRQDLTQFTATCARLAELISALAEGHKLTLGNVL